MNTGHMCVLCSIVEVASKHAHWRSGMNFMCEWCGHKVANNDRMAQLCHTTCGAWVCYECALAWVSEPRLTLDLDEEILRGT